jgi:alpha-beta hydrolase superfamily lysophospholipase
MGLGLAAGLIVSLLPTAALGQANKPIKANFESVDGVALRGIYYPSAKRTDAPCVLILPAIGTDIKRKGWDSLALKLQAKGCAVLMFDYRGHGDSTNVDESIFWRHPQIPNATMVKGANGGKPRDSISWKDFRQASYFPALVNDIAAAKAFLDRKNDAGELNSANLILIGEGNGAALGALWLKSEWSRRRVTGAQRFGPMKLDPNAEGKDVIGAIWLSFNPVIGPPSKRGEHFDAQRLLTFGDGKEKTIAMAFLYGEKDKSKGPSEKLKDWLKKIGKKEKPNKLIGSVKIADSGKATGRELLQKDLETEKWIVNYVEKVMDARASNAYDTKDFKKSAYVWYPPGASRPIRAKDKDEKSLLAIPWTVFR